MVRFVLYNCIVSTFATVLIMVSIGITSAQVMQSGSYHMQSDSINFGGGISNSTNYTQESTFGEVATGESGSASYNLYAGYQQMQAVYIALTAGANVVMDGAIDGVIGGFSNGSTTVTATTDGVAGYELTIEAETSPAMTNNGESIADYSPSGDPDLHFTTGSSDAHFGFSPFGVDVVQQFTTNDVVCNVSGSASSTACWDGLSTTAATIAQGAGSNHPSGATTTVYFKVGVGATANPIAGTYVATSTITLLPL